MILAVADDGESAGIKQLHGRQIIRDGSVIIVEFYPSALSKRDCLPCRGE
jgi:hypothetical protein